MSLHSTDATMSFGDHLEELRRRLLFALAAPLPVFIVLFLVSDPIIEWLLLPVYGVLHHHGLPTELQVLSPPEFLVTKLKLSAIAALVVTSPWIIWQAWCFVAPGLYREERRFVYFLLPGSAILSVAGVALLYYVMLPLMLHVLVLFAKGAELEANTSDLSPAVQEVLASGADLPVRAMPPPAPAAGDVWLLVPQMELYVAIADDKGVVIPERVTLPGGRIDQSFRVSFVVNFTLVLLLGIVIAFQMPLVIVLLGWLGLVSAGWLRQRRRYAVAICGIVAAITTPADAVSMIIMLVPLYGLYELGILLLVIAPASAVAEGRFRWKRTPGPATSPKPIEPVQSDSSVARRRSGPAVTEDADDADDATGS